MLWKNLVAAAVRACRSTPPGTGARAKEGEREG